MNVRCLKVNADCHSISSPEERGRMCLKCKAGASLGKCTDVEFSQLARMLQTAPRLFTVVQTQCSSPRVTVKGRTGPNREGFYPSISPDIVPNLESRVLQVKSKTQPYAAPNDPFTLRSYHAQTKRAPHLRRCPPHLNTTTSSIARTIQIIWILVIWAKKRHYGI